jgi:hypothetical protein
MEGVRLLSDSYVSARGQAPMDAVHAHYLVTDDKRSGTARQTPPGTTST